MKKIALTLVCFSLLTTAFAQQNWPDCRHLTVTSMAMDNDSLYRMKITIANSCDTCNSGVSGPVYLNLRVVRTISPFDTIADCHCYSFQTPPNNGSSTYRISSAQPNLPANGTYKVQFSFGVCDSIPVSTSAGLIPDNSGNSFNIYPNPATNSIELRTSSDAEYEIRITDSQGKMVRQLPQTGRSGAIDIADLPSGFYLLTLSVKDGRVLRKKIVKE